MVVKLPETKVLALELVLGKSELAKFCRKLKSRQDRILVCSGSEPCPVQDSVVQIFQDLYQEQDSLTPLF